MEHTMKNKVYLVILSGGGDTYIKVVDQETFDWICSDDMGLPENYDPMNGGSWEDQLVPVSQVAKMKMEQEEYECYPLTITRGSWDNDRAIAACPADEYDSYDTVTEATKAIQKHGDVLEDEYQGCMY